MTTCRNRLVAGLTALMLACPLESPASPRGPSDRREEDRLCGVEALALLGRLRGLDMSPDRVDEVIGPPSNLGHSLSQLIEAGRACGLPLRGVRLEAGDWPLDGPAILHLRSGGRGHFVVIRPVIGSHQLVQILEPGRRTEVLDFDELSKSWPWTGAALVAQQVDHDRSIQGKIAGIGAGLASLFAAISGIKARRRLDRGYRVSTKSIGASRQPQSPGSE